MQIVWKPLCGLAFPTNSRVQMLKLIVYWLQFSHTLQTLSTLLLWKNISRRKKMYLELRTQFLSGHWNGGTTASVQFSGPQISLNLPWGSLPCWYQYSDGICRPNRDIRKSRNFPRSPVFSIVEWWEGLAWVKNVFSLQINIEYYKECFWSKSICFIHMWMLRTKIKGVMNVFHLENW